MLSPDERNILIIRLSSLGDVLLTTPLIRSLKGRYKDLKIDFLVKKEYSEVFQNNPYLNKVFLLDTKASDTNIELSQYDLIVDLQNNFRSKKLTRGFKKRIVRFNKHSMDKFLLVHFKYNRLKGIPGIPVRYAETIGKDLLDGKGLDLFLPKDIMSRVLREKKTIGICPGSRHFTKRYPAEKFIAAGNLLAKEGYRIAVFGGKDERGICAEIAGKISNGIDLSTENDLFQTAADMKMCEGIICNDSGLMHVACAAGVPVITIFGSSVREFGFAPYNNRHFLIERKELRCRPCSHIGLEKCPKKHFRCMQEILPDEVSNSLIKLINNDV
ncbi:MAG: glycosyltransferase family 9 protein [Ignavibacteriaceae bacterium]